MTNVDGFTHFLTALKDIGANFYKHVYSKPMEYVPVNKVQLLKRCDRQIPHADNQCGLIISGLLVLQDDTECTHILSNPSDEQYLDEIIDKAAICETDVDCRGCLKDHAFASQLYKKYGLLMNKEHREDGQLHGLETRPMVPELLDAGDAIFFRADLIHLGPGRKVQKLTNGSFRKVACPLLFANAGPKGLEVSEDLQINGFTMAKLFGGVASCEPLWVRQIRIHPDMNLLTEKEKFIFERFEEMDFAAL